MLVVYFMCFRTENQASKELENNAAKESSFKTGKCLLSLIYALTKLQWTKCYIPLIHNKMRTGTNEQSNYCCGG